MENELTAFRKRWGLTQRQVMEHFRKRTEQTVRNWERAAQPPQAVRLELKHWAKKLNPDPKQDRRYISKKIEDQRALGLRKRNYILDAHGTPTKRADARLTPAGTLFYQAEEGDTAWEEVARLEDVPGSRMIGVLHPTGRNVPIGHFRGPWLDAPKAREEIVKEDVG